MPLADLDVIGQDVRLSPAQRSFVADIATALRSIPAPGLDQEKVGATVAGKQRPTVTIALPHRTNLNQRVELFVEPDTIVFTYGYDHMHFGYGEPDPPVEEAIAFLRDLLSGRIEVEFRGWGLAVGVTTYRVRSDGSRKKLQEGGYLGWISVPFRRKTQRISFQ